MTQVKAQLAVNGCSLNKGCNTGLSHLWTSLRAQREAIIRVVTYTDVGQGREQDAEALRSLKRACHSLRNAPSG